MLQNEPELDLSRAFLYYQERVPEGDTSKDAGATIRDICKATQKYGICRQDLPGGMNPRSSIACAASITPALPVSKVSPPCIQTA
jgi:hypothetical protein